MAWKTWPKRCYRSRDSLEAALAIEILTLEGLKSGVELTLDGQLNTVFEKANPRKINQSARNSTTTSTRP